MKNTFQPSQKIGFIYDKQNLQAIIKINYFYMICELFSLKKHSGIKLHIFKSCFKNPHEKDCTTNANVYISQK